LIGYGRIGQVHLGNLRSNPRAILVAVVEPVEASKKKLLS